MGPFEMVVAIIAIVTIGGVVRARMGVHKDAKGNEYRVDNRENDRLRDEVKALKERIAVLERLATDDNSARNLDREIEKLR